MTRLIRSHPALSFFGIAWLASWVFMVPLALARHGVITALPGWLHYLSAYGPLIAAALCARAEGPASWHAWTARLVRWRAAPVWWVLALSPLLLLLLAGAVERVARGAWPDPAALGRANFLPDLGGWALALWLLNSGLGEEGGWRGYALPVLQRRVTPRTSSVLIAAAWMVWHVPAFFYLPSYERLGPGMVIGFFVGVLSGAFLLTWLANGAGGSALLPIVWHATFNWTTASPEGSAWVAAASSTAFTVLGMIAAWRLRAVRSHGRVLRPAPV